MLYDPQQLQKTVEAAKHQVSNLPDGDREARLQELMEAAWQRIEDTAASLKGPEVAQDGGRFDTLSLACWISVAEAAGVPAVPIAFAGELNQVQLMSGQVDPVLPHLTDPDQPGMVRLDYAAGARIKIDKAFAGQQAPARVHGAARGADGKVRLELDTRVIEMAAGYAGVAGRETVPVWFRPWIEAATVSVKRRRFLGSGTDSWPLEWRVFVKNGRVAGISAYYIQAPVREVTEVVRESARGAVRLSERLIAHLRDTGIQPWHPRYLDRLDEAALDFTLDFIARPDGTALLLEAGPTCHDARTPEWGAHPCFFAHREIDGWALAPDDIRALPR
jgi:hypothetical protein